MVAETASVPNKAQGRASAWRESRIVLQLGMALTWLVAAAAMWVGWLEYRNHVDNARSAQTLVARVLEDHATLSLDTAALALAALAERIAVRPRTSAAELAALLRDAQAGLASVRGFTLVDAHGSVLASTVPTEPAGMAVRVAVLGAWPAVGQERVGRFVAGRSMGDLALDRSAHLAVPPGVGFLPMLRTVRLSDGGTALLVALLNPDAFSNHQTVTLDDRRAAGVLASTTGEVLASTVGAGVAPGERVADHEIFHARLTLREHDAYEGEGLRGGNQIMAYRASRQWPVMVVVEYPMAAVHSDWWVAVRAALGVLTAAVLLLAAMTVVAWHGLRARERTRDLLDQAQAEVARRERELSITLKSVQELIFRTDVRGVITFVNARWQAIGGTSPQQAIGQRLAALAVPAQSDRAQALFSIEAGPGLRSAQITARIAGGSMERAFDVAVMPLLQQGRIVGFTGSAVDVTERVAAKRALQTQLAVTELMLEVSPAPLAVRDLQGRYRSVNRAWEDFTGLRRADVLGRTAAPHLSAAEQAPHRQRDEELLAQQTRRVRYEANVAHADGSRRDVVLEKVLVPGDGGAPSGILTVLTDVSEFRAAERATREARDAAEEASRAKSEFIANISHELRTPLQSILGFSELGALRGREQPRLAAMFNDILVSGRRMLALVNDLLDVSKLESAVGTFHLERTDLRPLVRDVTRELEPLLAAKALRLDLQLSELPLIAKVDPLRFQQVVRNVLANAIRFSPPRGLIALTGAYTPQAEVALQVADQGPGIPPEELERIFDAFVQSSGTKDGSGGTGLGLTICRKILEIHGGRIAAANRPGGGAEFSIHLPARGAVETAPMGL